MTHEKVIEAVMKEFDGVLPVKFGTIASNADEIRNLLSRRYREFKTLLRDMDHKVELGVKGIWKNMNLIFKEIVEEDKDAQYSNTHWNTIPSKHHFQFVHSLCSNYTSCPYTQYHPGKHV